ncbi:lipocalin-like [Oncorhynchus mykiss]|uniref:lipocalin-like n=1 Tax=Oncorhynchus mykiss TaxID=8022 RepID=UPI0018784EFE|nr:lipocalin-like [Oncorhynchus mykiss]
MNHLAKKTNLLGKLIYKSERWSNENDMRVVDVKYDEYALIHTKTKGVSAVLTNLYVYLVCHVLYRGTDLSPSLLQKFRQFSLDTGYPPPKNDECPAVKFHPCFLLSKRAPLISLHGIATRPVDPWQLWQP